MGSALAATPGNDDDVGRALELYVDQRETGEPLDGDWRPYAACRGVNAELFYSRRNEPQITVAAKAVCRRCPVAAECLAEALVHREALGVWGGLAPRERARLLRRMKGTP